MAVYLMAHYLNPSFTRNIIHTLTDTFDQHIGKEGVENIAGIALFTIGLTQAWRLYNAKQKTPYLPRQLPFFAAWYGSILNTAVAWPGAWMISKMAHSIFSPARVEHICGPYTTYALGPRQIVSLATFALGLPCLVLVNFLVIEHSQKFEGQLTLDKLKKQVKKPLLFCVVSLLASPPALYIGHHLTKAIFNRILGR